MGYHWGLARAMSEYFELSAEKEELNKDFKDNEFIAKTGKALSITLSIVSPIGIVIGLLPMILGMENYIIGILFLVIGGCGVLLLPTLFSWRCTVNKEFLLEEYYILCFKCKKKILWADIKYQKVRLDSNKMIVFYNENKKRLISFEGATVGFNHIVKMAKRKRVVHIKKREAKRLSYK